MPFRHVQNDYQPEQIVQMTEALNLAWPQVLLANGASTPTQLDWLKQRLANFIIACASQGEFNPEALKAAAATQSRHFERAEGHSWQASGNLPGEWRNDAILSSHRRVRIASSCKRRFIPRAYIGLGPIS